MAISRIHAGSDGQSHFEEIEVGPEARVSVFVPLA